VVVGVQQQIRLVSCVARTLKMRLVVFVRFDVVNGGGDHATVGRPDRFDDRRVRFGTCVVGGLTARRPRPFSASFADQKYNENYH